MYAPTNSILDATSNRVGVWSISKGRALLARSSGRWRSSKVTRLSTIIHSVAITIVTFSGRRLLCAGPQKVALRGKGGRLVWRLARDIRLNDVLFAVTDGILSLDRVSCIVQSNKPGEPWITVATEDGTLFAEEILCRAS